MALEDFARHKVYLVEHSYDYIWELEASDFAGEVAWMFENQSLFWLTDLVALESKFDYLVLSRSCLFLLGSGTEILFWSGCWKAEGRLLELFLKLFQASSKKEGNIGSMRRWSATSWD